MLRVGDLQSNSDFFSVETFSAEVFGYVVGLENWRSGVQVVSQEVCMCVITAIDSASQQACYKLPLC